MNNFSTCTFFSPLYFFFKIFCLNVIVILVKWLLHIEILLQFNGVLFGSKCMYFCQIQVYQVLDE